jgi:hypothetical protein
VNTKGYSGRRIQKTVEVFTNDEKQPVFNLVIAGSVENFVTITPRTVSLNGFVGEPIKQKVSIIPEQKYAFKITNAHARNGKYINFQLEELKKAGKTEYSLTVENLRKVEGRYSDLIILQTDSKIQPNVNVRVYGDVRSRPVKE